MVWRGRKRDHRNPTPPHDITGKSILDSLPSGEGSEILINIMNHAQLALHKHPVNLEREKEGKLPANSIWLWGHGKTPAMPAYREKFGLEGAVISAVDLIKGIGICAGLDIINVEGATGYIDTNYSGKAMAALTALETHDFVYLHVEAPDEASHSGRMDHKIRAIEDFDREVVGRIMRGISEFRDYAILCTPDHPTPVHLMTHTSEPVPFVIYRGGEKPGNGAASYSEEEAGKTGVLVDGCRLMNIMIKN